MSETGANSDAAFCAGLVREHDFDRYASTLFVTPEIRRALLALYALNVEISRIRDLVSQPLPGEVRLQWWHDALSGQEHGGIEGNPVAAELLLTVQRFGLPVDRLTRLIDEHQFDLYNDPMPTMAALDAYLGDISGTLFALAIQVMTPPFDGADHLAHHAGIAQGILQVIASLPRDSAHRQLYVPLDLLAQHGVSQEEMFAGKATPAIQAMLIDLRAQARQHLDHALELAREAPPEARAALLPLALVRRDIIRADRSNAAAFQPEPRSRLATLWTLWRAARTASFRAR
ncbi:phytoene synthase [Bradyrhizobium sp. SSBR45G]|uniref:phytoene/squalene synthase family protein n=1 Tax=unclassified Bradyrhizobium TaxID=2631580 RepID=UPI002342AB61|nr:MULTISPECIES: phytoene/squalene synthase family protein [unclassified Bradyrhizobium]GLH76025.1 phytoene synthase [Bradyrhizobium sp. SSBR45G]GLH89200.1 phytoene synthase [Bradyrhizobium sp. SSBR45R]